MPRFQKAPDFHQLFMKSGTESFQVFTQFEAVSTDGRYLHWSQFRFRVPAGIDPELGWLVVQMKRESHRKKLELTAENGAPFQFMLTDSCHSVIHAVERLTTRLNADRQTASGPSGQNYLAHTLMMEEAISSAQLEGAATTRQDAKAMLESERKPRNDDERMILNNFLLMQKALEIKDQPLTLELICELHETATTDIADPRLQPGRFRSSDDVYVDDAQGNIAHQPPAAELLPARLQAICDFANNDHDGQNGRTFIHPVVKAIILHFMLGYEHPFTDGNGRTARALFYWFMLKSGYWPFEYISISALLKRAPRAYGSSFLYSEDDSLDLTYFIDYQLSIIQRAMLAFQQHVEQKKRELYDTLSWLQESRAGRQLNVRQGLLLRKAVQHPGRQFGVKEVQNDYNVSEGTARTDLEKLTRLQVLARYKEGREYRYIAKSDALSHLKVADE